MSSHGNTLLNGKNPLAHLFEISKVFLRLGAVGFGGPIAIMALMEEEICRRRNWLSHDEFVQLYTTCKVLPGPVATQLAIGLGRIRGGTWGGIAAGFSFVLPSFLLVLAFSVAYQSMSNQQPSWFSPLFGGFQSGAIAAIFLSTLHLSRPYRDKREAWLIAGVSAALVAWNPRLEPWAILCFGFIGAGLAQRSSLASRPRLPLATLLTLFWVCFKAGAFVFGSGLAIVPLLETDVVKTHGWLTHSEFMDGLAIGQITPGPVVITTTFIGHRVAGVIGAAIGTLGVFLPGFFNMLVIVPFFWKRFFQSPRHAAKTTGFIQWAIPAVIGGILATAIRLSFSTLKTAPQLGVLILAFFLLSRLKAPAWLVIPGAGAGLVFFHWLTAL